MKSSIVRYLCVAALGLVLLFCLTGCQKAKVDATAYVSAACTGYNGYGTAEPTFDADTFVISNLSKFKTKEGRTAEEVGRELAALILEGLSVTPAENLTNGDEVTISASFDKTTVLTEYGILLNIDKTTATVSGLTELVEIDPFEAFEINFVGSTGYGTIDMTTFAAYKDQVLTDSEEDFDFMILYSCDREGDQNLVNGDTVTVTAEVLWSEEDLKRMGVTLGTMEKTFTVEGLSEVDAVNPFDYLDITVSGLNGSATLSYKVKENAPEFMSALSFLVDNTSRTLSNGDVVGITIPLAEDEIKTIAEEYGVIFETTSYSYTIENLGAYPTSSSDFDTYYESLVKQADDALVADMEEFAGVTNLDWRYVGTFYKSKPADESQTSYAVVYQLTANLADEDSVTFITYITFDNSILYPDGTVSCTTGACDNVLALGEHYYHGYSSLQDLYDDLMGNAAGNADGNAAGNAAGEADASETGETETPSATTSSDWTVVCGFDPAAEQEVQADEFLNDYVIIAIDNRTLADAAANLDISEENVQKIVSFEFGSDGWGTIHYASEDYTYTSWYSFTWSLDGNRLSINDGDYTATYVYGRLVFDDYNGMSLQMAPGTIETEE